MANGRGKTDPMSKAHGSLNPLRDAGKWVGRVRWVEARGGSCRGQKSQALKAGPVGFRA